MVRDLLVVMVRIVLPETKTSGYLLFLFFQNLIEKAVRFPTRAPLRARASKTREETQITVRFIHRVISLTLLTETFNLQGYSNAFLVQQDNLVGRQLSESNNLKY